MRAIVVFVLVGISGCLQADLTVCGDGRACPSGLSCDEVHASCVTPAQATVCTGVDDGERCDAAGLLGICDRGYCIAGCGDGVQGTDEECDDANHRSHDGCSSACLVESATWLAWQSLWRGRAWHTAVYDELRGTLEVFGGLEDVGSYSQTHWSRRTTPDGKRWTKVASVEQPPPRAYAAMAYDSTHNVTILFGGTGATGFADTWEYDGSQWRQRFPAVSPWSRYRATMVYDSGRDRMLLFGGVGLPFDDQVWEYATQTATWTKIATTGGTPPLERAVAAYDPSRALTVVVALGETWEYDGALATWTRYTGPAPDGRYDAAIGYLPGSGVVLFGGHAGGFEASDTWEYRATGWTRGVAGPWMPPGRAGATLTREVNGPLLLVGGARIAGSTAPLDDVWAYDPAGWRPVRSEFTPRPRATELVLDESRDELVAFEGSGLDLNAGETWVFDGVRWILHVANTGALRRAAYCSAYDPDRERVIVFGGSDTAGTTLDTQLEWNGATRTWTAFAGARPPPRFDCALAYDRARHVLVLFGGYDAQAVELQDVWEFDGTAWVQRDNAQPHPTQPRLAMAYDPVRAAIVTFTIAGRTWTYTDGSWTLLELATQPPPRQSASLTFSPDLQKLVLFGGDHYASDVWALDASDWTPVQASEGPRPRASPAVAALPAKRSLVLFGGTASGPGSQLDDTWLLTYVSPTVDEDCGNGIDDDSDRRVDAGDPDCAR